MLDGKTLMIRRFPSYLRALARGRASSLGVLLWLFAACGGSRCGESKPSTPSHAGATAKATAPRPLALITPPRADLQLVLLTDPLGYLEPCGCQKRPLGGLDKLATVVKDARASGVPTLVLSAGDFAVGTELRPDDAEEARAQEQMRARTFVQIWASLAPAAIAPGSLDLAQQASALADLSALAGFPWLADNASVPAKKAKSPLAQARIVDAQGRKIGLLGLVAPDPAHPPSEGLELAEDLAGLAAQKSEELRAQGAELVIALVSGDRRAARAIASKGPDVVLMGGLHVEQPLPPAQVGGAVVLHAGQQGQYAVTLDLGLAPADAGPSEWEDASNWTRREAQKDLEQQIGERRERIASWEKDAKVDPRDLAAQRERLRALEQARDEPATPKFAGRWFAANLIELAPEVPGDREVGSVIDAHDRRVNEHNRVSLAGRLPLPAPPGTASYAGSESCASCHKEAYAWWKSTKHGHAYATLEAVHKEFNLSCVGCHVVGYNRPGGSTVTHVDNLQNVGCESCHGPGSLHNAAPKQAGLIAKAVPETVCASCHTHEHSDRFVFDAFRQMLIVPGHGRPSDRQ
ncbi:MAG: Cytochrome c family protein [Myxococcaceae bacterium]|nr:Cytochrome c family protein [Myxococcaceae bacterium]